MPRLPFMTMIASLILGLGPDVLLAQQAEPATVPGGVEPLSYLDRLPPLVDREVFFGNPEISGGELSPDGRWVSFIKPLDGIRNVWVKAIDEPFEAARPMTADSTRPVQGYFWSQDSRVILFVQDQGGNENFHVYSVDPGAEPAAGSQVPPALDLTPLDDVRAAIYAVPENDPSHILVGLNDRDAAVHDVYRIDITTGERELVLQNDENVAEWVADLDGGLRLGVRQTEDGGWEVLRVDGDALTRIYACGAEETCFPGRFHKDGKRVYLQTNKGEGDLVRLELMDAATGATELVESDPDGEVDFGGTIFSNQTEELIGTFYTGDRTRYYPKTDEFARDLERVRAALPEGDYGFRSMTEDGGLMLVSVDSDVDPSSTYVFDRESGEAELLYRVRPEVPTEHMATMKPVRYTARDGIEIPAYLTIPQGVEPENLAVVIFPHGGPWARDVWGFSGVAQFLANRGYAVLQPNFRGSTGYGKEFLNLGNEQWGTGTMQHDISDGARWLIDQGIADPDRVAIMGGSYGGYATLAGLAFTPDLYAAGVDIVGPSNIVTLLNSIPPYWKPLQKIFAVRVGDLNDPADVERMEAQSPLNSAEAITAPLLVIQGANDPRVKKAESDQIVVALHEKGQDVEYIVAANEGHGFANEDNNLAMFARVEDFLANHLGGRYQEEMPPAIAETLAELTVDVGTVELASATAEEAGEPITAFDGAAVEGDTRSYQQKAETQGRTMELTSTRMVMESEWDGRPALLVVESAEGAMGSAVDSVWVDPQTLTPIRRTIHQGPAVITLAFADGAVTGEIQAGPQTLPVDVRTDGAVFSTGPALELGLSTLPLEPGTGASIQLFEVLEGKVRPFRVEVKEPETVVTPAGSFEATPIAVTAADGSPDGQTVYVENAEPHRVVKVDATLPAMMGGGTATAVLAE
ncbi:MAG: alpha/beta fold hydrolase [Gemmatimonadota bacterium]